MEPTRAEKILWALAAIGFGMALLGAIGEWRGWWNDVGEVLVAAGTLLGIVTSATSLVASAGRGQVDTVRDGIETTHGMLGSMDGKLDSMDAKLDELDRLEVIEEALVAEDGRTSRLDVVQTELDRQTGVLDRQVRVLEQIRDAG